MSFDYNYQPVNFEDLILFDESSIEKDNVYKYIPSYLLFATAGRFEQKSIEYIKDKIRNYRKYHYANFFRKGDSNFYIGPIIKGNSFQLFYIDKEEEVFIPVPDLLRNKDVINTKEVYKELMDYRKLRYTDKIENTPFFLKIEVYLLWVRKIENETNYIRFLQSFKHFLLEVYSNVNLDNNPILRFKIKSIFEDLKEMNSFQRKKREDLPRNLYSFYISPEYMCSRAIESVLRSDTFQQFVWFSTPEEAIAYNWQNYHTGSLISGRVSSLTNKNVYRLSESIFITPKECFSSISTYAQENVDLSKLKSLKLSERVFTTKGLKSLIKFDKTFANEILSLLKNDLTLCNLVPEIDKLFIKNKEQIYYLDVKKNIRCPLYFVQEPQPIHRYKTCKKRNAIELYNLYVLYQKGKIELLNFKNRKD